jgi:hypothetical protein
LPGDGLPSPGNNRKRGATSTVATALPGYGLLSPGDSRKCAVTSTTARNKRQKIATPETATMPTNVSEAETRVTSINVNEAEVEEEQVCWLCGGSPCDWVEYSTELLEEVEEKFPLAADGNRVDALTQEVVSS